MIDFSNAIFLKLKPVDTAVFIDWITPMLIPGERALLAYQSVRDGIVFTDKRIIAIDVQGLTGKKKDFSSLPYNRIQAFSVATAGNMELDSELDLWFSGLGQVTFEFDAQADATAICRMISERVL